MAKEYEAPEGFEPFDELADTTDSYDAPPAGFLPFDEEQTPVDKPDSPQLGDSPIVSPQLSAANAVRDAVKGSEGAIKDAAGMVMFPAYQAAKELFGRDSKIGDLSPEQQDKWLKKTRSDVEKNIPKVTERLEKAIVERDDWIAKDIDTNTMIGRNQETDRIAAIGKVNILERKLATLMERQEQVAKIDEGLAELPTENKLLSGGAALINSATKIVPDVAKTLGVLEATAMGKAPSEATLWKAGAEIAKYIDGEFKGDPARKDEFTEKVFQGAGSSAPFLISGGILGATKASTMTMMALGGSQAGVAGVEEAIAFDATTGQQLTSFITNFGVGMSEALPFNRLMGRLNTASKGKVKAIIKNSTAQGLEELTQEIGQTLGSNFIASELAKYDEGRELLDGAGEAGFIGGVVGALIGGGTTAITRTPEPKLEGDLEVDLTHDAPPDGFTEIIPEADTTAEGAIDGIEPLAPADPTPQVQKPETPIEPTVEPEIKPALEDALIVKTKTGYDFKGQDKAYTKDVFKNPSAQPSQKAQDINNTLTDETFASLPQLSVPVESIIPTQRHIRAENMDKVKDTTTETGAFLLKDGDQYFALDGHHRIAANIINGEDVIQAHVYDVSKTLNEQITTTKPKTKAGKPTQGELFKKAPAVESKPFKNWFGKSKIVDKGGKPMVVHHGSANEITEFKKEFIGDRDAGFYGRGFYFTPSKKHAQEYASTAKPSEDYEVLSQAELDKLPVSSVYVKMDNPFVWTIDGSVNTQETQNRLEQLGVKYAKENLSTIEDNDAFMRGLKSGGYDGVHVQDAKRNTIEVIALEPTQIKSVDNKGAFDKKDPRIMFDKAPKTESAAFKKWFKDSKVVDKNGNPQIVYHGTDKNFESFDPEKAIGGQHWFTTSKAKIERGEVGAQGKGKVVEAYLSLQNPAGWKDYDRFGLDELIREGYDGLKLVDKNQITYVAFEPEQIKSVDNRGTFDPNDARILYDKAPTKAKPLKDEVAPAGKTKQTTQDAASVTSKAGSVKGLHEITRAIAQRFKVVYGEGRLGRVPKSVMGWYKQDTGATRGRKSLMEDIETFAHEVGHNWEYANGVELREIMVNNAEELIPLDYDPKRADKGVAVSEGFANYFKFYIINRAFAEQAAPQFTRVYEEWLDMHHEGLRKDLDTFAEHWKAYENASGTERIQANITRKKRNGFIAQILGRRAVDGSKNTKKQAMNEAEDRLIDGYAPMKRLVADLLRLKTKNEGKPQDLLALYDPFTLLRQSENAVSAAMSDAEFGVKGYNDGLPSGASLQEALRTALDGKPTEENIADFEGYLISRRAIHEWDRYFAGEIPNRPVLESKGQHEANIKQMETKYPTFDAGAKQLYEYQNNLLKKSFDAGHITQEAYDTMLERPDYVPFKRDISDRESHTYFASGKGGSTLGKNADKKNVYRGSGRPIISPLQSIMENTVQVSVNTMQTRIVNSLIDLARSAGRGSANFVEEVDLTGITATRVDLANAIKKKLNASDLNPLEKENLQAELDNLLDGDEMATIYQMSKSDAKNHETMLYGMKDGKQIGLLIKDPDYVRTIAEAMSHAETQSQNMIVNGLVAGARVFRAGITTHPAFAARNVVRDQVGGWQQTDAGIIPFLDGYRGAMSYVNRDMMYQAYVSNFGTNAGIETSTLQDSEMVRSVEEFAAEGITVKKVANLRAFAKLADASEVASRMGFFMKFYKKYKKAGLTDQEAMVEAAWEAQRIVDFSMAGRDTKTLKSIIPFLGAQVAGMTRSREVFFPKGSIKNRKAYWNYLRTNDASKLSNKEIREIELQRLAWMKATIGLGIPSLALMAMYQDDDDFKKFEGYERRANWIFKVGDKWIFVPKPFELASAANGLERAYEAFVLGDEAAAEQWLKDTAGMFLPPSENPLINIYYEQRANRNIFFDSPIVGMDTEGLPTPEQYNAYTSQAAIEMGQLISKIPFMKNSKAASPQRIEHAVKGLTGTWGRDAMRVMDIMAANRPATTAETAPLTSSFAKNPNSGSRDVGKMFNLIGATGNWSGVENSLRKRAGQGNAKAAAKSLTYTDDEGGKVYAVVQQLKNVDIMIYGKKKMKDTQYTALKRMHPMRRAKEASEILRTAKKDIKANEFDVPMDAREKQQFVDGLSDLHSTMSANGLIHSDVEGWRQRKLIPEEPKLQLLRDINPKAAKLIERQLKKKKITKETEVAAKYLRLKKKILPYVEAVEQQRKPKR